MSRHYFLILLASAWGMIISPTLCAQDYSGLRSGFFAVNSDTLVMDTLSIVAESVVIYAENEVLDTSHYSIQPLQHYLVWKSKPPVDSVRINYRVLSFSLFNRHSHKSIDLVVEEDVTDYQQFTYTAPRVENDLFEFSGLNKSGSISRGIGFGNNQDLTVNSHLNLELSGKITEDISILASISDDNIPIQPDGSTAQLQEFDQVFIKLFNENNSLTAGDFILYRPRGYFLNYYKRAQGVSAEMRLFTGSEKSTRDTSISDHMDFQVSGALSKGKFARHTFPGIEGNQGPYRLRGANNESFIIVIAGTEKIYIDGRLIRRGQENEYVIDYNTAEITFTANQRITKDTRITAEFQYTDINYARTLIQHSGFYNTSRLKLHYNIYSEQDSKNQPLQQDLEEEERFLLSEIGDSLHLAVVPSAMETEFSNEEILYKKVDTLGYSGVYVYSPQGDTTVYRVSFSNVGFGNGNYEQLTFNASGRIFEWVAPDTVDGVVYPRGSYEPVRVLATPKLSQMFNAGGSYEISSRTLARFEVALSNYDHNTFSPSDNHNNAGLSAMAEITNTTPLENDSVGGWSLVSTALGERRGENFREVERYRPIEFNRDWNIGEELLQNEQLFGRAGTRLVHPKNGSLGYDLNYFSSGKAYSGIRHDVNTDLRSNGLKVLFNGSYLVTSGNSKTTFMRHKSVVEKNVWRLKFGYEDEREENSLPMVSSDSIAMGSYRFYDWQFYLASQDTSKLEYKVFYRQRIDWRPDGEGLDRAALAENIGGNFGWVTHPAHKLRLSISNRTLRILDQEIISEEPENSLLSRIEYSLRAWKGVLTASTFYEIGAGLERRREFIYVYDPTGNGPYTWIDYNENEVKELNEFELARPEDGNRYIRVYTPTDSYIKAFTNQFNQSVNLDPGISWLKKEGLLKFLGRFSTQTAIRLERKTLHEELPDRFNPFVANLEDSLLVSESTSLRNTLFYNRSDSKYGADYTISSQNQRLPLTDGFEARELFSHRGRIRWNITSVYNVLLEGELSEKSSFSDIIEGRNYELEIREFGPTFSYQPSTALRLSLTGTYTQKENSETYGGEKVDMADVGLEFRFNQVQSGSFIVGANFILIDYTGAPNNTLAYEMLEGLQQGENFTWTANLQRSLGKNLQLNLTYNGRKSEKAKSVHQGSVQVRAFF